MSLHLSISQKIVEGLYCEALVLSDEVRHAFASLSQSEIQEVVDDADRLRRAKLSEGLLATTRMMHAIAWLLNRRAYYRGEVSAFQLSRHGRLSPGLLECEAERCAMLPQSVQELIEATVHFYQRLLRLDQTWYPHAEVGPSAISRLRERLENRLAG